MSYSNGGVYEGEWQTGLTHGRGKITCANGFMHEGQYEKNFAHGHGMNKWCTGEVYSGEFVKGFMTTGTMMRSNFIFYNIKCEYEKRKGSVCYYKATFTCQVDGSTQLGILKDSWYINGSIHFTPNEVVL